MTSTEAPSRRELNKARTREAIIEAVRDLAHEGPVDQATVDQVAERAGISRRTFFNYYGSITAVLSEIFTTLASQILLRLDGPELREHPVRAMREVVRADGISAEFLSWLALLNCHQRGSSDLAVLMERAVWGDLAGWFEDVLRERLDRPDPLYVSTLAASVMSTFSAAESRWLEEVDPTCEVDETSARAFAVHLDRALSYLEDGWQRPA